MDKNKRWIIGFTVLLFAILVVFELFKPEPIDWSYDFRGNSKKPNGCYVYLSCLKTMLSEKNIHENDLSILDFLKADSLRHNDMLLYVTDDFTADSIETNQLLSSVNNGRTVFISALSFSKAITDTLGFEISFSHKFQIKPEASFRLKHNGGDTSLIYHFSGIQQVFFADLDTAKTCILGTDSVGNANLVSIRFGKGAIFLHLAPEVFSNYQILYGNRDYVLALSSCFRDAQVSWDNYLKPGNLYRNGAPSPLRYILSNGRLRTAYFLFLVTLFLLIVLGSKRRQQIIPVLSKPVNASLEFINIISGLYMGSADNLKMAEKKYTFFCDYLRTHYFLSAITENEDFYIWLSEKSGVQKDNIRAIFEKMPVLRQKQKIQDEELIQFVKMIDEFYNKVEGRKTKGYSR